MASERILVDSIFDTPVATNHRKRLHTPGSITNFRSHKKRRMSTVSVDLSADFTSDSPVVYSSGNASTSTLDRFIPLRPKTGLPLTISPRTNRMCKQVGFITDQRLVYRDEQYPSSSPSLHSDQNAFHLLRKSASALFKTPKRVNVASVTQNLLKYPHCSVALDSPGMTMDPYTTPISWSQRNQIAVACGNDVYYQNLETKIVSHLFHSKLPPGPRAKNGEIHSIAWGDKEHETFLASTNYDGLVEIWDAGDHGSQGRRVHNPFPCDANVLSWKGHVLAFGDSTGGISFVDVRAKSWNEKKRFEHHKRSVIGLEWSPDGTYLASGDVQGIVHVWDRRACKSLVESGTQGPKMKHKGAVKALAWCPWKPDLLATGSHYPEGKIQVWSISSMSPRMWEPLETYTLNSSVHSLIWSPHCKELLSTHGYSFEPTVAPRRRSSLGLSASTTTPTPKPKIVRTPYTNSIVVHEYPSGKRLLRLSNAHIHAVTSCCISPDGRNVFTASPGEQDIKMWRIWGSHPVERVPKDAFDGCVIR